MKTETIQSLKGVSSESVPSEMEDFDKKQSKNDEHICSYILIYFLSYRELVRRGCSGSTHITSMCGVVSIM